MIDDRRLNIMDSSITVAGRAKYNRPKNGEYDLRDSVIEALGGKDGIAYSGGTFRRYGNGVWTAINELEVRQEVAFELRNAEQIVGVRPTYNLESSVTNALKSVVYAREDEWNKYPNIIVFKNRAIDTGTMQPVDHSPRHMATVTLPYDFDPKAEAPTWEQVLADLLSNDERRFLQRFVGYCLIHSVKHQMTLWFVGPPAGGKSTLIAGLEAMLGDLVGTLGLSQLQGSDSRFALANIPGKTLTHLYRKPEAAHKGHGHPERPHNWRHHSGRAQVQGCCELP
jgi:hypothetical protein